MSESQSKELENPLPNLTVDEGMRIKHMNLASSLLVKAAKGLEQLQADKLTAGEIIRMIETGVKLERLSSGEATEMIAGKTNISGNCLLAGVDLSRFTDEELAQLERLAVKALE